MKTVKNNQGRSGRLSAAYGPAPGPARTRPAALSKARAAVYDLLAGQPEPVALSALVERTRLHPNTVREHLQALVEAGLVMRESAAPQGRGRPAWLYRAVADTTGHEYAGLAAALAASIQRNSEDPRADARTAGSEWGRALAREESPAPGEDGTAPPADRAPRERVIDLLDRIGFAPRGEPGSRTVRLTRCPLLEAAHRYPDVVCGVHLGIVTGALAEWGDDATRAELDAFAEPGACLLHLDPPADPDVTGGPAGS